MDMNQAAEIRGHALDAVDAVHRISDLIAVLSEADRSCFAPYAGAVYEALEFGLLRKIYDHYPELRPADQEEPLISSILRWSDVPLPAAVSEADVDALILSVLTLTWQKTAMVVAKAHRRREGVTLPVSPELLAARIQALVDVGRLECQGNLAKWRHSEVRRKHG